MPKLKAPCVLDKAHWPPNYQNIFQWRLEQLRRIGNDPRLMYGAIEYYRDKPVEWITHWVDTYDPRNALMDLPTRLPFVLFERQAEMVDFLMDCLEDEESGLIDKSRDMGATWLCCAVSVYLWLYHDGAAIGWGSRKEALVDKLGDPKSILEKIRMIILGLPQFFWPRGFNRTDHLSFMKIINPQTGANITGEAGDQIGRGGRTLVYFVDEAAHLERAESVESALTDNTRVKIDISTPCGVATVFDRKREAGVFWTPGQRLPKGRTRVFVLDWSDHPAKDQKWHDTRETKMKSEGLGHIFKQEVDRDPAASLQGIIIPQEYIRAAVDAHITLKLDTTGLWAGALDVADEGGDMNALTLRKGIVLNYADDWGEGDTGKTTRRVVAVCRDRCPIEIQYDCIGVGAGVKSEANRLQSTRGEDGATLMPKRMTFVPWNAGAGVLRPDDHIIRGDVKTPINKDFYANLKAQGWWNLRLRFERTWRAIHEKGFKYNEADLISLDSKIPKLRQLMKELSQPMIDSDKPKVTIDKKPDGSKSPNLADSVMMNYFPLRGKPFFSQDLMEWSASA